VSALSVMHLICPRGMYGAERWIVALNSGLRGLPVDSRVCIPIEGAEQLAVIEQFRDAGCEVEALEVRGNSSLAILAALHDAVANRRPDVIHTHGYKSDILGLLAARRAAVPLVATPHGYGRPRSLKHRALVGAGKFALRFADHVAPLSQQLENEVLAAGVPRDRVSLIENAVDLDELDTPTESAPPKSAARVIGFVGQMIPRKRIDHLLRIFDRLWAQDRSLELHLVGSGESKASLERQADTLASRGAITFFGFRRDRLALMRSFDVFATTSSDEGVPRCLMEAMAMGIAAVGYDIPGVDALIIDRQTGLIVPSGDETAFADACSTLLSDTALREQLAETGRKMVRNRYSNRRMAEDYLSLYQRLVAGDGAA